MIGILFALAASGQATTQSAALALCTPALARRAGGEIATVDVDSFRSGATGQIVRGNLTAFLGMGAAPGGSATTHHLIRADFRYRCRIRHGRVREAVVAPLRP